MNKVTKFIAVALAGPDQIISRAGRHLLLPTSTLAYVNSDNMSLYVTTFWGKGREGLSNMYNCIYS